MTDIVNVPDGISGMEALKPSASLIFVTPEMAERWLGLNPRNRNIRRRHVDLYAKDMTAGNWRITGEAVKFDRSGNVLDGQHRLLAIVQSGATVPLFVVRGLDSAAQDVMDTGLKRTAADALGLNGYKNASTLGAATRLAINYEAGHFRTALTAFFPPVTNAEVLDYVVKNPDIEHSVNHTIGMRKNIKANSATLAFTFAITSRIDFEQAVQFFADLNEMRTKGQGDPRYTLLRRLASVKDNAETIAAGTEAHYIFRAWNAVRAGEELQNIKTGNAFGPFAFAVPS